MRGKIIFDDYVSPREVRMLMEDFLFSGRYEESDLMMAVSQYTISLMVSGKEDDAKMINEDMVNFGAPMERDIVHMSLTEVRTLKKTNVREQGIRAFLLV